jgi:hypothetical protein
LEPLIRFGDHENAAVRAAVQFVAHAKSDIPALVAEVSRLRKIAARSESATGRTAMTECTRCDGCGQVVDSDEGDSWTPWSSIEDGSFAVTEELVWPTPCPDCAGSGAANPLPEGQQK